MTVEEQLLLNTLSKECERLHKAIEGIKVEVGNILNDPYAYMVKQDAYEIVMDIIDEYTKGEQE